MGSKKFPDKFAGHGRALPEEPIFTLLARDPQFGTLVREWAARRHAEIMCGVRPHADQAQVAAALDCATDGEAWRRVNAGKWSV
jgi:hypothetical protein